MPSYRHSVPDIAAVGRLLGDPSRAAMVVSLMDGRAWTVGELARHLGIAKASATEHAHRLVEGGLLAETHQGRHRYLRLAGPEVAEAAEALGAISARGGKVLAPTGGLASSNRDAAMRRGRTCYRHLAGELGVRLLAGLRRLDVVTPGWELGPEGAAWFAELGVVPGTTRQALLRPCLDWTERRDHLAGSYADALCEHLLRAGWVTRRGSTRAVELTDAGRDELGRRGLSL